MSKVTRIDLFPGKGMRPATVGGKLIDTCVVTTQGLRYHGVGDREIYPVVPSDDGGFMVLTPRGRRKPQGPEHKHPADRNIKTIDVDLLDEGSVRLSARGIGEVAINLCDRPISPAIPASLHGGVVWGQRLDSDAAGFIGHITKRPDACLMRVDRQMPRTVAPDTPRSILGADSRAVSLGSAASLATLNELRRAEDVPMLRYRPNVEVDALPDAQGNDTPFAEDLARRISLGGVAFRVGGGIVRCVVTNLSEEGDLVGGGLSLLRPRRGRKVDAQGGVEPGGAQPIFCVSLEPELSDGEGAVLSVGDSITVLEWGKPNIILETQPPIST